MPERWRKVYDPEEVELPPGVLAPEEQLRIQMERLEFDCRGDRKAALKNRCGHGRKPPLEPESEEELRIFISEYYGMISSIDHNVGRVLGHLGARGIGAETMVAFLSDRGTCWGNTATSEASSPSSTFPQCWFR